MALIAWAGARTKTCGLEVRTLVPLRTKTSHLGVNSMVQRADQLPYMVDSALAERQKGSK